MGHAAQPRRSLLPVEAHEYAQSTYDKVAEAYDDLWSRNVAAPNARLTRALALRSGERVVTMETSSSRSPAAPG